MNGSYDSFQFLGAKSFLGNNNFGMAGSITAGCFIYAFDPDP